MANFKKLPYARRFVGRVNVSGVGCFNHQAGGIYSPLVPDGIPAKHLKLREIVMPAPANPGSCQPWGQSGLRPARRLAPHFGRSWRFEALRPKCGASAGSSSVRLAPWLPRHRYPSALLYYRLKSKKIYIYPRPDGKSIPTLKVATNLK